MKIKTRAASLLALLGIITTAGAQIANAQIIPPIYTNTFPHGTNIVNWGPIYSNNLASVSQWLHESVTNSDGSEPASMQDYADFAATSFSDSGAFSWQQSAMDEAWTWATANGIPTSFTNGTLNLGAFLVSRENNVPNYISACDTAGAITIGTTNVWPGGKSGFTLTALAGTNTTISQWDEGSPLLSHTEFGGRVTELDGDTNLADHSTAVAGIMAAAGANNIISNGVSLGNVAKGMAYTANVQAWSYFNDLQNMTASVGSNHMRLSNHSYELIDGWYYAGPNTWEWLGYWQLGTQDPRFGNYTTNSAGFDTLSAAAPTYLQCWAAGNEQNYGPPIQPTNHYELTLAGAYYVTNAVRANDGDQGGYNTLSMNAVSKDSLTVGAINPLPNGFTSPTNVTIASFSSLGPTDDGRIKPDVVADGVNNIIALSESTYAYGIGSGTSFATPAVTGSIDLLRSWYSQTHTNSSDLLSSTVKGLVIETADSCTTNQGPSFTFGWGVMDTLRAANLINADATNGYKNQIKEVLLPNGQTVKSPVVVNNTNTPLRITICWIDPAAVGNAVTNLHNPTPKLVNDLDLRVISPTGVTNFPWILNPDLTNRTAAARAALATKGDDSRNNVEQVYIPTPTIGTYTLQVTHKGTLVGGQQWVSIVVSGNVPEPTPALWFNQIIQTGTNTLALGWPAVVGGQYLVQENNNLATTNWVNVGLVSARLTNVVTQVAMTNAQAFYRVIQQ